MNIYQFAMQMENDGENYYRVLAKECTVPGLARIFMMLADEEVKHYNMIERLSRKEKNLQLVEASILENVKNVFVMMQVAKEDLHIDTTKAASEYRKACAIEEMSQEFYLEKAGLVEDGYERQMFLRLAKEEENHLRIMENVVEFVSRPEPGNWLENAEWHHLHEY
jgi:rubrerythrin